MGGRPWRLVRASRRGRPPTSPTALAVGDVGGRPGGRRWGLQRTPQRPIIRHDHCDTELKLILFACDGRHGSTLSQTGRLFGVFQAANDRLEIIIANLHCLSKGGRRVGLSSSSSSSLLYTQGIVKTIKHTSNTQSLKKSKNKHTHTA